MSKALPLLAVVVVLVVNDIAARLPHALPARTTRGSTAVTAGCHTFDRGCCPALTDSTSGMQRPPWGLGCGESARGCRLEDRPPAPALTGEGLTAGLAATRLFQLVRTTRP